MAHRLSSVKLCDRIVVFDRGRIVDAGTYDELAERDEIFGELVRAAGGEQGGSYPLVTTIPHHSGV